MNGQPLTRHQKNRMLTHKKLINATVELVIDKGYDSISIQDITDRADLGRGTFYIHFKDKESAVWGAVQYGLEETELQAHSHYSEGIPEQCEYYGYLNIFRHADQHRKLYKVMLGSQGSAAITARVHKHLAEEFENDMESLPEKIYADFLIPKQILSQVLTGAIIQLVVWWLETPNTYSVEQIAALFYESIHHKKAPTKG